MPVAEHCRCRGAVRLRFCVLRAAKWLVPAERCLTLPLAVRRKRFLVPLCVFCLGMVGLAFAESQQSYRAARAKWDRNWSNPRFYRRRYGREKGDFSRLLRREDHHDPPALHLRVLLQLGDFGSSSLASRWTSLKPSSTWAFSRPRKMTEKITLSLLGQQLLGPVDLGHQVVVADLGAQPELLVLAVVRVAFVLPLFLLVLELAEVHDAADGRLLLRRDFDEVEPDFAGLLQRLVAFR